MQISTTILEHTDTVAAENSAAEGIIDNVLSDAAAEMIHRTLQEPNNGFEYGASTAVDSESGTRYTTDITKGHREGVAPLGISDMIISNQTDVDINPENKPSVAMDGKYSYEDLIGIHTHPVSEATKTGGVGLSATDIRDDVFAGDHIATSRQPYDVYRAKAAIIFTDNNHDLLIDNYEMQRENATKTNWMLNGEPYPEETLLDSRPEVRPWLHLVERTDDGASMNKSQATAVHNKTLNITPSGDAATRYKQVRHIINHCISELLIPLSP